MVQLNTARVSAVPFNRRWPGHQRCLEETELINFLSCAADEPLEFEITPKNPFEKIDIRPKSLEDVLIENCFLRTFKDILIDNLYWNGRLVTKLDGSRFVPGEFTENIRLKASDLLESK